MQESGKAVLKNCLDSLDNKLDCFQFYMTRKIESGKLSLTLMIGIFAIKRRLLDCNE